MEIQVTGKHVSVTDAIRDAVKEKTSLLCDHFSRIIRIEASIEVERGSHIVEMKVFYPQKNFVAHAETKDMYASISQAVKKIHSQMDKDKSKQAPDHETIRRNVEDLEEPLDEDVA